MQTDRPAGRSGIAPFSRIRAWSRVGCTSTRTAIRIVRATPQRSIVTRRVSRSPSVVAFYARSGRSRCGADARAGGRNVVRALVGAAQHPGAAREVIVNQLGGGGLGTALSAWCGATRRGASRERCGAGLQRMSGGTWCRQCASAPRRKGRRGVIRPSGGSSASAASGRGTGSRPRATSETHRARSLARIMDSPSASRGRASRARPLAEARRLEKLALLEGCAIRPQAVAAAAATRSPTRSASTRRPGSLGSGPPTGAVVEFLDAAALGDRWRVRPGQFGPCSLSLAAAQGPSPARGRPRALGDAVLGFARGPCRPHGRPRLPARRASARPRTRARSAASARSSWGPSRARPRPATCRSGARDITFLVRRPDLRPAGG